MGVGKGGFGGMEEKTSSIKTSPLPQGMGGWGTCFSGAGMIHI